MTGAPLSAKRYSHTEHYKNAGLPSRVFLLARTSICTYRKTKASVSTRETRALCGYNSGGMFAISSRQQIDVAFGLTLRLEQVIGKGEGVLQCKPPNLAAYTALSSLSRLDNSLRRRHICGVVRTLSYGRSGGIRKDERSEDGIARM